MIVIPVLAALVLAFYSCLWAEKFKALKFILKFYEIIGWFTVFFAIVIPFLCLFWPKIIPVNFTYILIGGFFGIPVGFGLIMLSQFALVQMEIADNTRETMKILKSR